MDSCLNYLTSLLCSAYQQRPKAMLICCLMTVMPFIAYGDYSGECKEHISRVLHPTTSTKNRNMIILVNAKNIFQGYYTQQQQKVEIHSLLLILIAVCCKKLCLSSLFSSLELLPNLCFSNMLLKNSHRCCPNTGNHRLKYDFFFSPCLCH